jgi:hypothetical protein
VSEKMTSKKKTKKKVSNSRQNPDKLLINIFGERVQLSDIKNWMMDYMESNPYYDPRPMANKASIYFRVDPVSKNLMETLAFDLAEKFEYDKQRNKQRKSPVKTKGFPLGLGNSPFKKQNPDGKLPPRGITLPEVKKWMIGYIKTYPDYDPREMAKHAITHLNIQVTPADRKIITDFAYKVADDYEMKR